MAPVRSKPLYKRKPLIISYVWYLLFPFQEMQIILLRISFICGTILIQRANHTAGRTEPHESLSGSPLTRANQQANHPFKVHLWGLKHPHFLPARIQSV